VPADLPRDSCDREHDNPSEFRIWIDRPRMAGEVLIRYDSYRILSRAEGVDTTIGGSDEQA
jgi:hypothetical protein